MTDRMREALQEAAKHALRRVHDNMGAPPWPAPSNTLRALVRAGLVEYSELVSRKGHRVEIWSCTELGREALKAPGWTAEEQPVFMARGGGHTSERARAIDELELMGEPSWRWRRESALARAGAVGSRGAAGRVARSLKAA